MKDVIIHKKVGMNPVIKKINIKELKTLQELVGGYMTTVSLPLNILMVCNDEGMLQNLPVNFYMGNNPFFGDVFFCSYADFDFAGLNEEQLNFIKENMFKSFDVEGKAEDCFYR